MNINDGVAQLITNRIARTNTVKPSQISQMYSLASERNGVGFLHPNGTVTFHNVTGNQMVVDHQQHRVLRNGGY